MKNDLLRMLWTSIQLLHFKTEQNENPNPTPGLGIFTTQFYDVYKFIFLTVSVLHHPKWYNGYDITQFAFLLTQYFLWPTYYSYQKPPQTYSVTLSSIPSASWALLHTRVTLTRPTCCRVVCFFKLKSHVYVYWYLQ